MVLLAFVFRLVRAVQRRRCRAHSPAAWMRKLSPLEADDAMRGAGLLLEGEPLRGVVFQCPECGTLRNVLPGQGPVDPPLPEPDQGPSRARGPGLAGQLGKAAQQAASGRRKRPGSDGGSPKPPPSGGRSGGGGAGSSW